MDWTFLVGRGGGGSRPQEARSILIRNNKGQGDENTESGETGRGRKKGGPGGGTRLRTEPAGWWRSRGKNGLGPRTAGFTKRGQHTACRRADAARPPARGRGPAGTAGGDDGGRSAGTPRAAGPALPP